MKKPSGHPFNIGQRVRSRDRSGLAPDEKVCPRCNGTGRVPITGPKHPVRRGTVIGYGKTLEFDDEIVPMVRVQIDGSKAKQIISTFADDWEDDPS